GRRSAREPYASGFAGHDAARARIDSARATPRMSGRSRILVTGGGGFVGSHLVERLRAQGEDPFVARRRDYDLTVAADVERLLEDARPELVYHLAAEVGGIGANRANP